MAEVYELRRGMGADRASSCVSRVLWLQNNVSSQLMGFLPIAASMMFVYVLQSMMLGHSIKQQSYLAKAAGGVVGFVWGLVAARPMYLMLRRANNQFFAKLQRGSMRRVVIVGALHSRRSVVVSGLGATAKFFVLFIMAVATSSFFADYVNITAKCLFGVYTNKPMPIWLSWLVGVLMVNVFVANVPNLMHKIEKNVEKWCALIGRDKACELSAQQLEELIKIYFQYSPDDGPQLLEYPDRQQAIDDLKARSFSRRSLVARNDSWCVAKPYASRLPAVWFVLNALVFICNLYPAYRSGKNVAEKALGLESSLLRTLYAVAVVLPIFSMEFSLGVLLTERIRLGRKQAPLEVLVGSPRAGSEEINRAYLYKSIVMALVSAAPPLFFLMNARGQSRFSGLLSGGITLGLLLSVLYVKVLSRAAPVVAAASGRTAHQDPEQCYAQFLVDMYQQRVGMMQRKSQGYVPVRRIIAANTQALIAELEDQIQRLDDGLNCHESQRVAVGLP